MSKYIRKEDIISVANGFTFTDKAQRKQYMDFLEYCINNTSKIKAKPIIKGKWYTTLDKQKVICSNCRTHFKELDAAYWKHCPECGAEMEWW